MFSKLETLSDAATVTLVGFIGGLLDQVRSFPWYFEVLFYAGLVGLSLALATRLALYLRHRRDAPPPAAITQTMVEIGDGASVSGSMEGNVMGIHLSPPGPTTRRLRRLRLSEEAQARLVTEGRDLAQRLSHFAGERKRGEPSYDFPPPGLAPEESHEWSKQQDERRARYRADTHARYHEDLVGDVAEYLDEVDDAGIEIDPGLRRNLGSLAGPHPIEDLAHAVQVLSGRIERYGSPWWRKWF